MCGINGIIKFGNSAVRQQEIERMNAEIKHRGPDDQGIFLENNIGLGHLRLSIVDLSKNGHQPMIYKQAKRKVVITFNGEIYNFLEIREDLASKGYIFNSKTDTEVILAAYLEYGFDCLKKFNGFFAFVIYDPEKNIIFGARDRFGKKPLKYFFDEEKFIFSSELKAILTHKISRKVDFEAIDHYLTLQYVPAPKTGFSGIFKLPHAHYFILDLEKKKLEIKQYFDLDFSQKMKLSDQEWCTKIEEKLTEAVSKRLIADVPIGAFLSGGVDSSAIVAIMAKKKTGIKTFSISFDEKEFDESKYARQVANLFQTEHTEFRVNPRTMIKYLEKLIYHFEEPYADSSQLPTYVLSKLTREKVTVALSGDGGDEIFGGYQRHRVHVFTKIFYPLLILFYPFYPIINFIGIFINKTLLSQLITYISLIPKNIYERHYNFTNYFDERTRKKFYRKDFVIKKSPKNIFQKMIPADNKLKNMDKIYYLDINSYLPDDINVKVDMASMANALEVRSPLLDFEIAEMSAKIPWRKKTSLFHGKKIFKKMLENHLPKELLYRKKHGFSLPIKYWFREDLKEFVTKTIMNPNGLVLKIMKETAVKKLLADHQKIDNSKKIWALMALNIWYRKYFIENSIENYSE